MLVIQLLSGKNIWPLEEGVAVQGRLKVNSTIFMLEAIKRGQGVGFIPDFVCREALYNGELVEVLTEAKKPDLTLYALYPARHFVPSKLVQCISYLEQWFSEKNHKSKHWISTDKRLPAL